MKEHMKNISSKSKELKKRVVSVALVLCMLLSMVVTEQPLSANAAVTGNGRLGMNAEQGTVASSGSALQVPRVASISAVGFDANTGYIAVTYSADQPNTDFIIMAFTTRPASMSEIGALIFLPDYIDMETVAAPVTSNEANINLSDFVTRVQSNDKYPANNIVYMTIYISADGQTENPTLYYVNNGNPIQLPQPTPAPTPYATTDAGTVSGAVGTSLEISVSIKLIYTTLTRGISHGEDLSSWCTNLPQGVRLVKNGGASSPASEIWLTLTGTPQEGRTGVISFTVPAAYTTAGKDLVVQSNLSWNISDPVGDAVTAWKTTHSAILGREISTVNGQADYNAINDALLDYDKLPTDAKSRVQADYEKLEQMAQAVVWRNGYNDVLTKTPETVSETDLTRIESALGGYDCLKPEVQEALQTYKEHLENLKKALNAERDAETWKATYAGLLGKELSAVTAEDLALVVEAGESLDSLSKFAQEKLSEEVLILAKIACVANWRHKYAEILAKDTTTVTGEDAEKIVAALDDYNKIPSSYDDVKTALADEKAKLEAMKPVAGLEKWRSDYAGILEKPLSEITAEDADVFDEAVAALNTARPVYGITEDMIKSDLQNMQKIYDVLQWKKDHPILTKTPATVATSDLAAIETALTDYEALTPQEVKDAMAADKANLEAMKAAIEAAQTEADQWQTDHADILGKDSSTVTVSDLPAINAARAAYDELSGPAKENLTADKAKLDAMKAAADELDADAKAKAEAWRNEYKDVLDKSLSEITLADLEKTYDAHLDWLYSDPIVKEKLQEDYADIYNKLVFLWGEQWKNDHKEILSVTPSAVIAADREKIETAITNYEAMIQQYPEMEKFLTEERAHLDALLEALDNAEADANQWKEDHKDILAKNAADITLSDADAIKNALVAYDTLSAAAKEKLTAEKEKLDAMKIKLDELQAAADQAATEAANKWKTDNGDILAKEVADVTLADADAVKKALDEYDDLSDAAKAKLTDEKAKLDAMQTKLDELQEEADKEAAANAEANQWKEDHKDILAKGAADITLSDADAIDKALAEYDKLSDAAKAKLTEEKAKLDAMKTMLEELQAEADKAATEAANKWKEDHADILAKDAAKVTIRDRSAVNNALAEYAKLSPEAQAKLTEEKAKLDAMKRRINELQAEADREEEAEREEAEREAAANAAANRWKENHKDILATEVTEVTAADADAIKKALEDYENLSYRAQSKLSEEKAHLDELRTKLDELQTETDKETEKAADEWKKDYADLLGKNVAEVTAEDRIAIDAALDAYDTLPDTEKAKLTGEKAHLDALMAAMKLPEGERYSFSLAGKFSNSEKEDSEERKIDVTADVYVKENRAEFVIPDISIGELFEKDEDKFVLELDVSRLTEKKEDTLVHTMLLPADFIGKALKEVEKREAALECKLVFDGGVAVLSHEALSQMVKENEEAAVEVIMVVGENKGFAWTEKQKAAFAGNEVVESVFFYIMSNGKKIEAFENGTVDVTVTLEKALPAGQKLQIAYVTEDVLKALAGTYDAKTKEVHFVTDKIADTVLYFEKEQQEVAPEYKKYTVVRGDTLGRIAKKHNCTVKELLELNRDLVKNPDLIYPGWKLVVPEK